MNEPMTSQWMHEWMTMKENESNSKRPSRFESWFVHGVFGESIFEERFEYLVWIDLKMCENQWKTKEFHWKMCEKTKEFHWKLLKIIFRAHKMNQWKWMDEPTLVLKMKLLKNHFSVPSAQNEAMKMNGWTHIDS